MNKNYLTNNSRTNDIIIGKLCGRSKSSRQPIDPSGVFFEQTGFEFVRKFEDGNWLFVLKIHSQDV